LTGIIPITIRGEGLPGQNTSGFNSESQVGSLPLETCDTINQSWGYNAKDGRDKSARQLIHYLARAAGQNANFLLNVGPMPSGEIQPEFGERIRTVGAWLARNAESIYGTRGGPKPPASWGAMTQKPGKIYLHVLDWNDDLLAISDLPKVKNARLLATGAPVGITTVKGGIVLQLPREGRDDANTVVVLETVGR
jgi:alpha-L-fucosidase